MAEDRFSQPAGAPPRSEGYKPIEDYGRHWRPAHRSPGRKRRLHRLVLSAELRLPQRLRLHPGCQEGGLLQIAPVQPAVQKQMYLPETCVLVTRFLSPDGVCEVIDFMPVHEQGTDMFHANQIVRQVRVVRGSVHMKVVCEPAFDYARTKHTVEMDPSGVRLLHRLGGARAHVAGAAPHRWQRRRGGVPHGRGRQDHLPPPPYQQRERHPPCRSGVPGDEAFRQTVQFWRRWIASCRYQGRWREVVQRSALTLKLLTFAPTGAIVAAPTMSLPEEIGGGGTGTTGTRGSATPPSRCTAFSGWASHERRRPS